MVTVMKLFEDALCGPATDDFLNNWHMSDEGFTAYFDDFLGDGDYDSQNKTEVEILMNYFAFILCTF